MFCVACIEWIYSTLVACEQFIFFCGLLQIIDNFLYLIRQKGEQREREREVLTVGEEKDGTRKMKKLNLPHVCLFSSKATKKKNQPECTKKAFEGQSCIINVRPLFWFLIRDNFPLI